MGGVRNNFAAPQHQYLRRLVAYAGLLGNLIRQRPVFLHRQAKERSPRLLFGESIHLPLRRPTHRAGARMLENDSQIQLLYLVQIPAS